MKVSVKASVVKVTDGLSDAATMTTIGNAVVAFIRGRTGKGRSALGDGFAPYSTAPIYISRHTGTGRRLVPKGGRRTKSGKSVFYEGGYAQYRQLSTGSGVINLTLSGQLMRAIRVSQVTASRAVVDIAPGAAYGAAVNDKRRFMGIAPDETKKLGRVAKAAIKAYIKRQQDKEGKS